MRKSAFGVALILGLTASAAFAQQESKFQAMNDRMSAAVGRGDGAAVTAMYAADAKLLPPGVPMMTGREAIGGFWKAGAEQIAELKLHTVSATPMGANAVVEVGTYALTTKAQPPDKEAGKYVVVWRKVGGAWKIATDIWNADK